MAGLGGDEERFLTGLAERHPDDAEIFARLALVKIRAGRIAEGEAAARRAVSAAPDRASGHAALGLALARCGRVAEGVRCLEDSVRLDPEFGLGWLFLGEVLAVAGAGNEAAGKALQRAAALLPGDPRPPTALGGLLMSMGRHEDALAVYRQAVALAADPTPVDLLNNLGVALERLERREEAVAMIRSAAMIRPDSVAVQDNLGNALLGTARAEEAEACHRRALALGSKAPETWSNLGNALHRQGRLDEADDAYRRAIAMSPDNPKFHTNLALNLLLSGRMEEGWREYEWRWRGHPNLPPYLRDRVWAGEPLPPHLPAGGTLLLQAEQGYGDTLQFIRHAPLVRALGVSRVVLACQPELIRIAETMPGLDLVVGETAPLPPFDKAVTLLSLPRLLADLPLPNVVPYLSVPLGAAPPVPETPPGHLRVGLAWAGRPTHGDDWNRSVPARLLAPILEVDGVSFLSLQRGAVGPRLGRPNSDKLIDAADLCADFCDTAALLRTLDLVISVDTAVVHLAGALGRPVWVMLPPVPDFRWRMEGEDSEWYPSFRLFRRRFDGGWERPVAAIAEALRALVAARRAV